MTVQFEGEPPQDLLKECLHAFEVCSRRAIECLLGKPTFSPRKFCLMPWKDNGASEMCIIQAENSRHVSVLTVGLQGKDYADLFPQSAGHIAVADALGEIANVLAWNFLTRPPFSSRFGSITPDLPVFITQGVPLQNGDCMQGILVVNQARILLGLKVHTKSKDDSQ